MRTSRLATILLLFAGCAVEEATSSITSEVAVEAAPNLWGTAESMSSTGDIDRTNPFFTVRENGRSCESCHDSTAGWTITPELAQARFEATDGLDPLFAPFDASGNPDADHSTVERRRVLYSLLLQRGLIRFDTVAETDLAGADFVVTDVEDPFGYSTPAKFSRFRRASSIANEAFSQTLLWHGVNAPARALLEGIAAGAAAFHTEHPITPEEQTQMADFMQTLVHAQATFGPSIRLDDGARGGASLLASAAPHGMPEVTERTPPGFSLYGPWLHASDSTRRAIARGEVVFNTKAIAGSGTLLDPEIKCASCHDVPNIGDFRRFVVVDLGTADPEMPGASALPVLTVVNPTTHARRQVTDLGHALETRHWNDIGKFAIPKLRGLASRAPYFHNGAAATLVDVVDFYERHFHITWSGSEKSDLIKFLAAL